MELNFSKIDLNEEPSAREKIYFGVILVLIAVAIMRLIYFPTLAGIKNKKADINNVKLQMSTLEKFIEIDRRIEPLPGVAANTDKSNENLEKALFKMSKNPKKMIADTVKEITSRNAMGSVILNNLSLKPAVVRGSYVSIPVSLNVIGTFTAMQSYLTMIEKLDYLVTIDNISFELSEAHPGLVTADLNASIYASGDLPDVVREPVKKTNGGSG